MKTPVRNKWKENSRRRTQVHPENGNIVVKILCVFMYACMMYVCDYRNWPSPSSLTVVDVCIPRASADAVRTSEDWRRWADHPRRCHHSRSLTTSLTSVTGWSLRSLESRALRTLASRCTARYKDPCCCLALTHTCDPHEGMFTCFTLQMSGNAFFNSIPFHPQ